MKRSRKLVRTARCRFDLTDRSRRACHWRDSKQKPRAGKSPRGSRSAGYRGHRFSRAATPHDS